MERVANADVIFEKKSLHSTFVLYKIIEMIINLLYGSRGRAVKASDSKSDSLWERRFESCRLRKLYIAQ